jgi:hypothetical protein
MRNVSTKGFAKAQFLARGGALLRRDGTSFGAGLLLPLQLLLFLLEWHSPKKYTRKNKDLDIYLIAFQDPTSLTFFSPTDFLSSLLWAFLGKGS